MTGVLRGPSPRSFEKSAPLGVSHTFVPVAASMATTYSVLPRVPSVKSRPPEAANDE